MGAAAERATSPPHVLTLAPLLAPPPACHVTCSNPRPRSSDYGRPLRHLTAHAIAPAGAAAPLPLQIFSGVWLVVWDDRHAGEMLGRIVARGAARDPFVTARTTHVMARYVKRERGRERLLVCACVHVCVRACVCGQVCQERERERETVGVCVCACVRACVCVCVGGVLF
jgi:hypothetical protein